MFKRCEFQPEMLDLLDISPAGSGVVVSSNRIQTGCHGDNIQMYVQLTPAH